MARSRDVSAGLLVYRRRNGIDVLLVHPGGPFWRRRDAGSWSIPKGIVESGDLLACARREFTEETGLIADREVIGLSPVRQKSGKTVHAFALEADLNLSRCRSNTFEMEWPPKSGRRQRFPEVDRVAYFDIPTALRKIHAYQRPLIVELTEKIGAK